MGMVGQPTVMKAKVKAEAIADTPLAGGRREEPGGRGEPAFLRLIPSPKTQLTSL